MSELTGVRVLLVDDDPDARSALTSVLEFLGARATAACSAADARLVLKYVRPDVIVSDLCMPGETGFQFIDGIRKEEQARGGRVPAVAISAYLDPEQGGAACSAGFDAFLTKPFDIGELAEIIGRLIRDGRGLGPPRHVRQV